MSATLPRFPDRKPDLPLRSPLTLPLLVLTLAAFVHARAHAGEEITTDRPDVVESADIVPNVQIEAGLQQSLDKRDGLQARALTTPTLLRIGVSRSLELRLESDGYINATVTGAADGSRVHDQGLSDAALGVKWRTQGGDEAGRPSVAWLADVEMPSGSAAFRGSGWRPSLRLVSEWELPNEFSLGIMPGIALDRTADGHEFATGLFAATLGNGFAPGWDAFVEIAAQQIAAKRYGGDIVTFDTGVSRRLTADLEFDAALFVGLTHETPALSWGVGGAYRF